MSDGLFEMPAFTQKDMDDSYWRGIAEGAAWLGRGLDKSFEDGTLSKLLMPNPFGQLFGSPDSGQLVREFVREFAKMHSLTCEYNRRSKLNCAMILARDEQDAINTITSAATYVEQEPG